MRWVFYPPTVRLYRTPRPRFLSPRTRCLQSPSTAVFGNDEVQETRQRSRIRKARDLRGSRRRGLRNPRLESPVQRNPTLLEIRRGVRTPPSKRPGLLTSSSSSSSRTRRSLPLLGPRTGSSIVIRSAKHIFRLLGL